ncbi:MAG: OmpA family protein [Deltaproteobacteria bacterium]|nr:OmpA family protein [Deltaproteobacteria bacterium]
MSRFALVALFALLPLPALAVDPTIALRIEAGGASGLTEEVQEHGLAVHFGGRVTYRLVEQLAAGVRVAGSFFPPAGTSEDISHTAYEAGLTARLAPGLWADGYLGLHHALQENGFGFDLGAGYDLAVGSSGAGVGPFVSYSLAAVDQTQHFVQFGIGGSFGLPGVATARANDTSDPDGDTITGDRDQCPDEAEDVDGSGDEDGCPDPDNDGDRILDANDECANEAEDVDQFEDENGCPDPDNDGDGVLDANDRCNGEVEDRDNHEDDDGCPDPDNDADQVPDASDRCPEPEDRDGWQDDDGCPDTDNDGDGKADADDSCPNEPQTGTSTDGCPQRVRSGEGGVQLLEQIRFRGPNLDPASSGVLDDLAAILKAPNAPGRITLRVHMHPAGAAAALVALSQRRAEAVKAALVSRQVPVDHIDATGVGGEGPLAQGNGRDARLQNERVEVAFVR